MDKIFHRRNLPHLYFSDGIYFITARLANTIALSALKKLKISKKFTNDDSFEKFKSHFLEYDSFLDNISYSKNYLINDQAAEILQKCFRYPDKKEYFLICYTIMPNHFHIVFELLKENKGISKIMQAIKGTSAYKINRILSRTGKFWQDESYDRWVRDDKELYYIIRYTLNNPVAAGLVNNWQDWKYTYCHPNFLVL